MTPTDPTPLAREYARAALQRHRTQPARPEVDSAYEAARDALRAALDERGGEWTDGTTRYVLDPHGSPLLMPAERLEGRTRRDLYSDGRGGWTDEPGDGQRAAVKLPATDEELARLGEAYEATIATWRERPVTRSAMVMARAKLKLEDALKTRGGKWGVYKLAHGNRLPKPWLETRETREARKEAS